MRIVLGGGLKLDLILVTERSVEFVGKHPVFPVIGMDEYFGEGWDQEPREPSREHEGVGRGRGGERYRTIWGYRLDILM
jgi:hypothetical protein